MTVKERFQRRNHSMLWETNKRKKTISTSLRMAIVDDNRNTLRWQSSLTIIKRRNSATRGGYWGIILRRMRGNKPVKTRLSLNRPIVINFLSINRLVLVHIIILFLISDHKLYENISPPQNSLKPSLKLCQIIYIKCYKINVPPKQSSSLMCRYWALRVTLTTCPRVPLQLILYMASSLVITPHNLDFFVTLDTTSIRAPIILSLQQSFLL